MYLYWDFQNVGGEGRGGGYDLHLPKKSPINLFFPISNSDFDLPLHHRLQVALATSDEQSILKIPATDATWKIKTMVLPELSRTMAYLQHATQSTDLRV